MSELTFGLFLNAGAQIGADHRAVFDLVLAEAELAERLGYRDVWVTEHHFIDFGVNANALTLAGFLLGRTQRLRVGTAVTLAPLYHPVQLAEQAAILDQASGGRFDFGLGRGGYRRDFEVFDIDIARWDDEIENTARVLIDAWTGESVASVSRWNEFFAVRVTPRPYTQPHVPLFMATRPPSRWRRRAAYRCCIISRRRRTCGSSWRRPMTPRVPPAARRSNTFMRSLQWYMTTRRKRAAG